MSTWTRTERTVTTVTYEVPAGEPWGAAHDQVLQAVSAARVDYRGLNGHSPSDDAIRVHVTDDSIRIVFEKKGVT